MYLNIEKLHVELTNLKYALCSYFDKYPLQGLGRPG